MKITTSDNIEFSEFEKFQEVVNKAREIPAIRNVNRQENSNQITYNGHTIKFANQNELANQIPDVLHTMLLCNWRGEVYSEDFPEVFHEKFAECLNFLLAWLKIIVACTEDITVKITALDMQSVIEYVKLIMKEYESKYSDEDFVTVENMIDGVLEKA